MSGLFDNPDQAARATLVVETMRAELDVMIETTRSTLAKLEGMTTTVGVLSRAINGGDILTTPKEHKPHEIKSLLTHFDLAFQRKFNGEKAPIAGAKDAGIMKRLLGQRPAEKICGLIDAFFESDDPFIVQGGYTVSFFAGQIGKLIADANRPIQGHGLTDKTRNNGRNASAGADMIRRSFTRP